MQGEQLLISGLDGGACSTTKAAAMTMFAAHKDRSAAQTKIRDMARTCCGLNLGYPINPARDLGPRIFAHFIYGPEVWTFHDYYFWIPIIAPLFGGIFAGWLYHVCIGAHIPDPADYKAMQEGADSLLREHAEPLLAHTQSGEKDEKKESKEK
ncbi:hypothetical protein COOONC_07556 [Cooperia oncophora]